jgi:molybdenum cofactor cytidylyltransferase
MPPDPLAQPPVVLVLASGAGRRFLASGGREHKLAAPLAGRPLIEHVMEKVAASGLPSHVVRGIDGGMGASIAAGVAATQGAAGWLVLPADLPLIRPGSLRRVAALLDGHAVVVPRRGPAPGHPVGFARQCLAQLLQLRGDAGARSVVEHYRARGAVHDEALEDDGIVMDIDTVDDLARIENLIIEARMKMTGMAAMADIAGDSHGRH